MRTFLAVIGSLITIFAFLPYLIGTIKGTVRPRIATWSTWALVTGIATIAELSQHAYSSALLTGSATFIELTILIVSLKKGDYDYSWVDGASQFISVIGIVAWLKTNNASYAIIFNMVADFFGAVPTFYHSWLKPHEEAWLPFALSSFGAGLSLLAVKDIGFVTAGFPIYLCVTEFFIFINIYFRQKFVAK